MAPPRVSVIIIVYNGEAYRAEAIDSVLAQSWPNFELLVVDDGSSDGSRELTQCYVDAYPEQVRLLRHPGGVNRGMSATRNLGLAHAKGELIAFLDADDVWAPGKLAEQVAILDQEPEVGMVYGRALIWHAWRPDAAEEDFVYDLGVEPDQVYRPPHLFHLQLKNVYQTPTSSGSLLRKSLVDGVGGFEAAFKGMFEDQVFYAKALLAAPTYVADAVWFKYRQHPQSATAESAAAGADDKARLRYLRWLSRYLAAQRADPQARQAVRSTIADLRLRMAKNVVRRLLGKAPR